jgi:hypothetical protein
MTSKLPRIFAVLVACGALAMAGTASAGTVQSFFQGNNLASDNDAEYVVETGVADGVLQVGEIIRGAFNIDTLNSGSANIGGGTANNQWSGVFSIRIRAITQTAAQIAAGTGDIYFEPDPGFAAWIASLDTVFGGAQQAPDGAAPGTGAMIRMYENPNFLGSGATIDFTTNHGGGAANPDDNVGEAAAGSWFWDMGMNGSFTLATDVVTDMGEVWVALNAALGFTPGTGINPGTSIGTGNAAINLIPGSPQGALLGLQSVSIPGVILGTLVNFAATTNIRGAASGVGGSSNAGFDADSDASFTFVIVPLPLAAWPGIALLGLLGLGRMRRRRLTI